MPMALLRFATVAYRGRASRFTNGDFSMGSSSRIRGACAAAVNECFPVELPCNSKQGVQDRCTTRTEMISRNVKS